MSREKIPMLVVCGPTASGKTAVAVRLAELLNGEIISADSMQIYKGLAISTAKPDEKEKRGIPHYMMDFLEPDESFSVADYVSRAKQYAEDIHSRGKLPILVGGTGLYINSLVDNISFEHIQSDDSLRRQLEEEAEKYGGEYMHKRLAELDPEAAARIHPNNVIRSIRAIEMFMLSGKTGDENRKLSRREESPYELCMIGLTCFDRKQLYDRIDCRVDKMLEMGIVDEVREVYDKYKLRTAFNAIGFKELVPYIEGSCTLEEAVELLKQQTRHYAKRQLTWFRRDARICWVDTGESEQFDGIIANCMNIVAKSKIM